MKKLIITMMIGSSILAVANDKVEYEVKTVTPITEASPESIILSGRTAALKNTNATFLYNSNNIYKIFSKPDYITTIMLAPDESINFIGGGDTENWLLEQSQGAEKNTNLVHIRPIESGLNTNLVVVTNKRLYTFNIESTEDMYNPLITFQYPYEQTITVYRSEDMGDGSVTGITDTTSKVTAGTTKVIDTKTGVVTEAKNNENYRINDKKQKFSPEKIYDDNKFTYINFKDEIKNFEMPVFYILNGKNLELTNFEIKGNQMIVERLFDKAILKVGTQEIKIRNYGK